MFETKGNLSSLQALALSTASLLSLSGCCEHKMWSGPEGVPLQGIIPEQDGKFLESVEEWLSDDRFIAMADRVRHGQDGLPLVGEVQEVVVGETPIARFQVLRDIDREGRPPSYTVYIENVHASGVRLELGELMESPGKLLAYRDADVVATMQFSPVPEFKKVSVLDPKGMELGHYDFSEPNISSLHLNSLK